MATDRLNRPLDIGDRVAIWDTVLSGYTGVILAISDEQLDIQLDDSPLRVHIESAHVDKID